MTDNQTVHITVSYRAGSKRSGVDVTRTYAVSENTLRKLDRKRDWLGRHIKNRSNERLKTWLEKQGCRLDSSDAPSFVMRYDDGSTQEAHYRSGMPHRDDGPAFIQRFRCGTGEAYWHDGKLDRKDGPAYAWHGADGSTEERYYVDGKLAKKEDLVLRSVIPEVTSERPAVRGPEMLPICVPVPA